MKDSDAPPHGSGQQVDDFSSFCEGDIEPTLNKKIHTLIQTEEDYIVYLDDDFYVEYSIADSYGTVPNGFPEVANRTSYLESASKGLLQHGQIEHFARLLGEAMARIIGDKNAEKANQILDDAESYLNARSFENARIWYIQTAFILTLVVVFGAAVLWVGRMHVEAIVGHEAFHILLASLLGAVGALFSILSRTKKLEVDPAAGELIHRLESGARIAVGSIGALVMALAVKANLLLGFTKSLDHSLAALLAICIVAGASERLVPSFIKKVEDSVSAIHLDKKAGT